MNNPPAFPQYIISNNGAYVDGGMTLRDYFAAKALIAWHCNIEDEASKHPDSVAIWCYQLADAMLKAREA